MRGIPLKRNLMQGAVIAYAALGSNLFGRVRYLREGYRALHSHPAIQVEQVSGVYESPAHTLTPDEVQPPFLNAVLALRTVLSPEELLTYFHAVEARTGRRRADSPRWAPRTLDLDLLIYGVETRNQPGLCLPHPGMAARRFVLTPLAELRPDLYLPAPFDTTVAELLAVCPDAAEPIRTPIHLRDAPSRVSPIDHRPE